MILPHFRLGNCLIYRVFVPSMSLIQVGTFLATIDFEEDKSMTDSPIPASNRTIMVVDDNHDLIEVVRFTLESNGFNVRCAYSGEELFTGLEELKPNLIILDIMMTEMDGLKVLTRLKEDPSIPLIPVILLSAKVLAEDIQRGHKMGANYYITKPFTKGQLLGGINLVLGGDQGQSAGSP